VTTPRDALAAWQGALAAEYAAAFGYGALGPKLTDASQVASAHSFEQAHRDAALTESQQLVAADATPVEPAANYPMPFALTDARAAQQLALRLESACASAWRFVISIVDAPAALRVDAVTRLTASAVRAVHWRAVTDPSSPTVPFPGI
jgi:hypothetical protein